MPRALGVCLFCLLAGCTSSLAPSSSPFTACSDPRPQVCTMEYAPVCAVLIAGGERTYSSACNACADDRVASYRGGECPG